MHFVDSEGDVFGVIDGEAAGNQIELIVLQRKASVEIQVDEFHLVAGLFILFASLPKQVGGDVAAGDVRIAVEGVIKRKALLSGAAADIQDFHTRLERQCFEHPLVNVATAKFVVNVDAGQQIGGGSLIIDFHVSFSGGMMWDKYIW